MDLANISRWFDDDELYDAYTGTFLFLGQVTGFGQANVSETLTQRRTVSIAPGGVLPVHQTVRHNADFWLLGTGIDDYHQGAPVRTLFSARRSAGLAQILTPGQAAKGAAGVQTHAQFVYLKSTVNGTTDAQYDPFWEVFLAPNIQAPRGYLIKRQGTLYYCRAAYLDVEGFYKWEADQLDEAINVLASFDAGDSEYDIVEETTGFSYSDVPGLLVDSYKVYAYATPEDQKLTAGERTLILSKDVPTPTVNQTVTLDGGRAWRVFAVQELHDAWFCRMQRS